MENDSSKVSNPIHESHNRLAQEIIQRIVIETLAAGGDYKSVLVVLESVVAGVVVAMARLGGDARVFDKLIEGVRIRMAELRLTDIDVGGHA